MKENAVVFVTDKGFLVPSLVAALQVLEQREASSAADIVVVLIDIDQGLHQTLERLFNPLGIIFFALNASEFLPSEGAFFNKTHVPKTTLGRLALHKVLPDQYVNIVYLDGDIQIVGDIGPLLRHRVAAGKIAAVTEGNWLCEGDMGHYWPKHQAYMTALGITDPLDYFNAGILAFRLDTWREMAPRALAYFTSYPERCLYHDQSALNAVFHGHRECLSPIYNYASLYADLNLTAEVSPRIIHFTGGNKPWHYGGPPWNGRFLTIYRTFLETYPQLASFLDLRLRQDARSAGLDLKDLIRNRLVQPYRRQRRRVRLRRYLAEGKFVV
ncbi:glycosyltransferase family 8 protein [Rhizobium rhizoryzae]|uniref:glycosyltransferase family 8 protein n=1 Tax=Rhizobium rhizoryzae TaxID=451876 RepID=UPI002899D878|nr:glycosyltransferase [Rhizobium rhizoryzae]